MNNVVQRAIDVWKPNFIKKTLSQSEKSQKTTWLFWFITSALAAIIWAVFIASWIAREIPGVIESVDSFIPQDAKIQIVEGKLSTQNIEPFKEEINAEDGGKALFIIDTRENSEFTLEVLESYENGALVLQDKFYLKNGNEIKTEGFESFPDFSYTKEQFMQFINAQKNTVIGGFGVLIFISMFGVLAGVRLLIALWWTAVFMLLGKLFGMQAKWNEMYFIILNLYFIPLVIEGILLLMNIHIPFITTLLFIALFTFNKVEWNKEKVITDES